MLRGCWMKSRQLGYPSYDVVDGVCLDEGHKRLRLKMKYMEKYVVHLTDEEFHYLVKLVTSEIEERERQKLCN